MLFRSVSQSRYETNEDISEFLLVLDKTKEKFEEGMDEDFNSAIAVGAVFELVKEMNKYIDNSKKSKEGLQALRNSVELIKLIVIEILGVELNLEMKVEGLANELIDLILDVRTKAKQDKNYGLADEIRNKLLELGIEIKDGKDKTAWTLKK